MYMYECMLYFFTFPGNQCSHEHGGDLPTSHTDKLTAAAAAVEPQLPADHPGLTVVPTVVAYRAPLVVHTHLHPAKAHILGAAQPDGPIGAG